MNFSETQYYLYSAIFINIAYILITISKKQYRLLLPSVVCCFTWAMTCSIMLAEVKGLLESTIHSPLSYVSPFVFYMTVVSIAAFTVAHFLGRVKHKPVKSPLISTQVLESIVRKFRWVLVVIAICAVVIVTTLLSIGGADSLGSYRHIAVTTELQGFAGLAIRISSHVAVLGGFYLIMVGAKQARCGVNFKELILCVILFGASNIAIAGRGWILAATLPYVSGFIFGKFRLRQFGGNSGKKNDLMKIVLFVAIIGSMFSIIGNARSDAHGAHTDGNFFDRFLYYTDGSHMADIALKKFKQESFELEYGANTLFPFGERHMANKFDQRTDHNYRVVVKSMIPPMYYDFGYQGALMFWGVLCFVLELICLNLRYTHSIFGVLLSCYLSTILFSSPIGTITIMAIPVLEWLLIIYLCRKQIFIRINGISRYL